MEPDIDMQLTRECDVRHDICHYLTNEIILASPKNLNPEVQIVLKNLDLHTNYHISIYFKCIGDRQFIFVNGAWVAGDPIKPQNPPQVQFYGPAMTGREWMKEPINFSGVTLGLWTVDSYAKNPSITFLHANHKYMPVISVHEVMPDGSHNVFSFEFENTAFIPVKRYKNVELKEWKTTPSRQSTEVSEILNSSGRFFNPSPATRIPVISQLMFPEPARPNLKLHRNPIPHIYISHCTIPITPTIKLMFVKSPPKMHPISATPVFFFYKNNPPTSPTDRNFINHVLPSIPIHQVAKWLIDYFLLLNRPNFPMPPVDLTDFNRLCQYHIQLWAFAPEVFSLDVLNFIHSDRLFFST